MMVSIDEQTSCSRLYTKYRMVVMRCCALSELSTFGSQPKLGHIRQCSTALVVLVSHEYHMLCPARSTSAQAT